MDFKKAMLGAASVLALTAGVQQTAQAAGTPDDFATKAQTDGAASSAASEFALSEADFLFNLVARTQGSLTTDAIGTALEEMFQDATYEQVAQFPGVLASLSTLVSADALVAARDVLATLVLNSSSIDSELRESVRAKLDAEFAPIVLAKRNKCYVGGREVPCNMPGAVPGPLGGAIGGGAGGGGAGGGGAGGGGAGGGGGGGY